MHINWIMSFILFVIIFIIFNIMNYYIFILNNSNKNISNKFTYKNLKNYNWKW